MTGPPTARVVVGFARDLRRAGVPAGRERVHAFAAALALLDPYERRDVYWAGRASLCATREDLERYDAVFAAWFGGGRSIAVPAPRPTRTLVSVPLAVDDPGADTGGAQERTAAAAAASRVEQLRHRDIAGLSAAERAEVLALVSAIEADPPLRRSRRRARARHGDVDAPRTIRSALRHGGEVTVLHRHGPQVRPRRVVLLVDVSGSMAPYADAHLRLAHAMARARPGTEVFTIGTRLTRVTREVGVRDPLRALRGVADAVPDWSGGTRLGALLQEFLDRWGQRGLARGAVVVIASDGWERGDAALLGTQAQRLARLAHRVVWANPHRGRPGYEPLTAGMQAVLPHVDALVPGHSLQALRDLVRAVAGAEELRSA